MLSLIIAGIPLRQAITAAHAVEDAADDVRDEDDQDDEPAGGRLEQLAGDEDLSEPVVSWSARHNTTKETETNMATTTSGVPATEVQPAITKTRTSRAALRAKVLELVRAKPRTVASLASELGEDAETVRAACKRLQRLGEVHSQLAGVSSTWAIGPAVAPAATETRPRRAARRAPAKKHAKRKTARSAAKKKRTEVASSAPTADAAFALAVLQAPEERVQLLREVLSMVKAGR